VPGQTLSSDYWNDAYIYTIIWPKLPECAIPDISDYPATLEILDDSVVEPREYQSTLPNSNIRRSSHHNTLVTPPHGCKMVCWVTSRLLSGHHNTPQPVGLCHVIQFFTSKYQREGEYKWSIVSRQDYGNHTDFETVAEAVASATASKSVDKSSADNMPGRKQLHVWKCSAGRSKSWRRFARLTTQASDQQVSRKWIRRKPVSIAHNFSSLLVWFPSALLRSQATRRLLHIKRFPYGQLPEKRSREKGVECVDYAYEHDQGLPQSLDEDTVSKGQAEHSNDNGDSEDGSVLGNVFIRFTWKDKALINGVGELDRFLRTGLAFCSGWRIDGFIRNDNHADVYSVHNDKVCSSKSQHGARFEAHVFLDEYHGNSQVFANRQKMRMRRSGKCSDSFWYNGRHIFVNRVHEQVVSFKLGNTEKEFPSLVDHRVYKKHAAAQRRHLRGRPSFADIVGIGLQETTTQTGLVGTSERGTELEADKDRYNKREKQKYKRKARRHATRVAEHVARSQHEVLQRHSNETSTHGKFRLER
jgi:hypothetical protein